MQLVQLRLIRLHRGELCAEVVAQVGFERARCLLARHLLMADRLAREQQLLPRLGRALQRQPLGGGPLARNSLHDAAPLVAERLGGRAVRARAAQRLQCGVERAQRRVLLARAAPHALEMIQSAPA